jgi:modulator of FtsH protease HflK
MAWNQPGGSKSPWGRRPGQGGTDLDEKVKSWQRKLESVLRGSAPGGETGRALLLYGLAIVLALWVFSGLYQIDAAEKGIIQRFGKLAYVHGPGMGLHWPWPIETLTKVNVMNVSSKDYRSRVLTSDVSLVELRFTVQYRAADPVKWLFQVRNPEETLQQVSESAIREVVGQSTLDDVLEGSSRPLITQRTQVLIQRTLNDYNTGIELTSVNLPDVQVPDPVVPAQHDTNKARADQARVIKEAQAYASILIPQAQGYAAKAQQDAQAYKARIVSLAEGQAARFSALATAYTRAPEVTRERLYLETMESVLQHANKVIIESKQGASNVYYLPLDKIIGRGAGPSPQPAEAPEGDSSLRAAPSEPTDTITIDGRARGQR